MDASVRARILVPTTILFALTLAAMVWTATQLQGKHIQRSAEDRARLFGRLVADGLMAPLAYGDPHEVRRLLSIFVGHRSDVVLAAVLDDEGRILSVAQSSMVPDPGGELQAGLFPPPPRDTEFSLVQRIEIPQCLVCRNPAGFQGWLDVRFSRQPVLQAQARLMRTLTITAVPSLLLLLAIASYLISREVKSPLGRLIAAMQRVQAGHVPVLADEGRPDELGRAARGFDAMCAALMQNRAELEAAYQDRIQRAGRFAMVGEMATGLAHEIKNPLSGLSGALELLAEDLAASPRHGEVVQEMRHQVTRLTQIMESLLDFARPRPARLAEVDVNHTLSKVLFVVGKQRCHRPLVVAELADDLPKVFADAAQLEQVFLNICLNACQAMRDGGTLRVTTSQEEEQVKVEIADTGPGILPANRPHVFKPFYTTKHDGNGLGLAISERIVSEHGGRIGFHCPPDGGTTFEITLPAHHPSFGEAAA